MEGEEEDDHSTFPKVWGVRFIRADFTAASSLLRRVNISRAPPPCQALRAENGSGPGSSPCRSGGWRRGSSESSGANEDKGVVRRALFAKTWGTGAPHGDEKRPTPHAGWMQGCGVSAGCVAFEEGPPEMARRRPCRRRQTPGGRAFLPPLPNQQRGYLQGH